MVACQTLMMPFIKITVKGNSSDLSRVRFTRQASTAYSKIGTHFVETRCKLHIVSLKEVHGDLEAKNRLERKQKTRPTHVIFDVDVGAELNEAPGDVGGRRRLQYGVMKSRSAFLQQKTFNTSTRLPLNPIHIGYTEILAIKQCGGVWGGGDPLPTRAELPTM